MLMGCQWNILWMLLSELREGLGLGVGVEVDRNGRVQQWEGVIGMFEC